MKITRDAPWWKYKHNSGSAIGFGLLFWVFSHLIIETTGIFYEWYNDIPISITFLVLVPIW